MINKINKKKLKKVINSLMIIGMFVLLFSVSRPAFAVASGVDKTTQDEISGQPDIDDNTLDINISSNAGSMKLESTLQILIMLTILSLAPSILIMVTSFTRIVVVFHFLRTALGTQTALFITIAIMSPVFTEVNTKAIKPYTAGKIKQEQAIEKGLSPLREFMLKQTREKDLKLFMDLNKKSADDIKDYDDIPITIVIPAFIISELRAAFIIGFLIYLPFIVIDMVVASTLMSMGMMMLPPTTISLPFKLLLFVLADGWNLVIGQLVNSFN